MVIRQRERTTLCVSRRDEVVRHRHKCDRGPARQRQNSDGVVRLTELGGTPFDRYPGEPSTSRDYLNFGPADDLPKHTRFEKRPAD